MSTKFSITAVAICRGRQRRLRTKKTKNLTPQNNREREKMIFCICYSVLSRFKQKKSRVLITSTKNKMTMTLIMTMLKKKEQKSRLYPKIVPSIKFQNWYPNARPLHMDPELHNIPKSKKKRDKSEFKLNSWCSNPLIHTDIDNQWNHGLN